MRPGQRKHRFTVIERGGLPGGRRVAGHATGWDARLNVIRIGCAVVVLRVTRIAVRRRRGEVAVDVTTRTRHAHVRARQREGGLSVIKRRRLPRHCRMASRARRRNSGLHMRRICRSVEVLDVAAVAIGWRALIFSADVARYTVQCRMRAGQRISRKFQMIELGSEP